VRERVLRRLAGSAPPRDLVAEALASLTPQRARQLFPAPLVPAAVLLALGEGTDGLEVLLTRRSGTLRDHPGQVSFPGGRMESHEADPALTAIREAEEEIGLAAEYIELAGYLPPQTVITGFAVSPVVGFLRPGYELRPDPREVAEVFSVPLAFLRDPANLMHTRRVVRDVELPVYEYAWGNQRIWGATAQMLRSFCRSLDDD